MNTATATASSPVTQREAASFPVRRMDLDFEGGTKYWAHNDPFLTHLMNALSVQFPEGEKFFVTAVRAHRDRITDPVLQREIGAFIGQEAMHSKEHLAYDTYAEKHGLSLKRLEQRTGTFAKAIHKLFPLKWQLASTCAAEHLTACMAAQLLRRDDLIADMSEPTLQRLWLWHAIEESEHKAVAYNVYQQTGGGYFTRVSMMVLTTLSLIGLIGGAHLRLMREDGQLRNWKSWRFGLHMAFGRGGFFTGIIGKYFDYYRPGFHPMDHDSSALEAYGRERLGLTA